MADHQKIHPESPNLHPTTPLFPSGTFKSDAGEPPHHHNNFPIRRTIPVSYSKPPKTQNCLCRCLCCTLCIITILFVIFAIIAAVIYFVFQPKIPNYSVNSMKIRQFSLNSDMSLNATFTIRITSKNPNDKIGIYYLKGSKISVFYSNTKLCEGSLPKFYQGHRNVTVLDDVALSGQRKDAAGLLQSLQAEQARTGSVPLELKVKVPVRLKIGEVKMMRWIFLVNCDLKVDSLTANNEIEIKDSSCKFKFRL